MDKCSHKPSRPTSPSALPLLSSKSSSRVILLLDLDCFYAQCETVRLNLPRTLPLCLLQWNSALAVNYPARAYGIKRGDNFIEIQRKGKGEVVALHLPIIPFQKSESNMEEDEQQIQKDEQQDEKQNHGNYHDHDFTSSIEQLYKKNFQLSKQEQEQQYKKEKNVMRNSNEGKASLDRYRLASSRIFSVILETLTHICGSSGGSGHSTHGKQPQQHNFILEKASIDELFVDVTDYCHSQITHHSLLLDDNGEDLKNAKKNTVIVHPDQKQNQLHYLEQDSQKTVSKHDSNYGEAETELLLWHGCKVAQHIRKAVFNTLGFTLSAGISINKLMAKLGASYGKPDGQAVIFPCSISKVMQETKIRKVRNLGGKLGKQVQSILPPDNNNTVSSIAQNLSLPILAQHLKSFETARFVFNICRGICNEPVKRTDRVLNKSITAAKSFPKVENLSELKPYIQLLVNDLITRVLMDLQWNNRWPKNCSVLYASENKPTTMNNNHTTNSKPHQPITISNENAKKDYRAQRRNAYMNSRSIRIPFLSHAVFKQYEGKKQIKERFEQLFVDLVMSKLEHKFISCFPIYRVSLTAIDFEPRHDGKSGGIVSFFRTADHQPVLTKKQICTGDNTLKIKHGDKDDVNTTSTLNFDQNINKSDDNNTHSKAPYKTSNLENSEDETSVISTFTRDSSIDKMHPSTATTDNSMFQTLNQSLHTSPQIPIHETEKIKEKLVFEPDLAYAQRLQASFDHENEILSKIERSTLISGSRRNIKRSFNATKGNKKLDSFFMKKSKQNTLR